MTAGVPYTTACSPKRKTFPGALARTIWGAGREAWGGGKAQRHMGLDVHVCDGHVCDVVCIHVM